MASAYKVAAVTRTEVTLVQPETVNLTLSIEEAETLTVVLSKVGGSPTLSARGHAAQILTALGRAGLNWFSLEGDPRYQKVDRPGIKFLDRTDEPVKLRAFKDRDGDLWFEVKEDAFVMRHDREDAEHDHGRGRACAATLEALIAAHGPVDLFTEV